MDDIYNQLYQNRYFLKRRRVILKKRGGYGHKQPLGPKLGTGFLLSLGLLIVIWSPLIILAALASSTAENIPQSSQIEVGLGVSTPPIFQARTLIDSTLTRSQYDQLQARASENFLDKYPRSSTALAAFNEASTSLWVPSPEALTRLIERLNSSTGNVAMTFIYSFQRKPRAASTEEAVGRSQLLLQPGDAARAELMNIVMAGSGTVVLNSTFPAFVQLDGGESASTSDLPASLKTGSTVELTLTPTGGGASYWTMSQVSPNLVCSFSLCAKEEGGRGGEGVCVCVYDCEDAVCVCMCCASFVNPSIGMCVAPTDTFAIFALLRFPSLLPCTSSRLPTFPTRRLSAQDNVTREGLQIVTLNEDVAVGLLQVLQGFGIAGLYVSFVLVVGRLIRGMMKGISMRIIYEDMPSVKTLVNLIHAIYVARESGEMALEEDLTLLLLQLYRSPEALITWTGSLLHDENRTFYDIDDPNGDIK